MPNSYARKAPLFPGVKRFPPDSESYQLAQLEAETREWIRQADDLFRRGRQANIEIGRRLIQIKKIVGHGNWKVYYKKHFGYCGIAERTARTYMSEARKSAESAVSPRDVDSKARAILDANKEGQKENAASRQLYKLTLHVSVAEQKAIDEYHKSAVWAQGEKQIVALLLRLSKEAGNAYAAA